MAFEQNGRSLQQYVDDGELAFQFNVDVDSEMAQGNGRPELRPRNQDYIYWLQKHCGADDVIVAEAFSITQQRVAPEIGRLGVYFTQAGQSAYYAIPYSTIQESPNYQVHHRWRLQSEF